MKKRSLEKPKLPDKPGFWRRLTNHYRIDSSDEIEVYPLDPVGGTLCIWGPEVGITFSGPADRTDFWDTDEWQGHVPVQCFCDGDDWEFVRDS